MRSVINRLLGFSGLSLMSALVPLMVLPLVARVGGEVAWGTIGVGQAVGSLVGAFSALGWGVIGPARIAQTLDPKLRGDIYASSYWSRFIMFVIVGAVGCAIAISLAPPNQMSLAVLMTISAGLSGLSLAWFSVGAGSPRILALFEVVPRLLASIAALAAVSLSGQVIIYPLLIILGTCGGLISYHVATYRRVFPPWITWSKFMRDIREDAAATGVNFVGSGFSVVPVPVVASIGSIADTARFSSADRLYRYSLFTITAVANSLQPWVLDPGSANRLLRRQRIATAIHLSLAIVGGLGLAIFGQPVSVLLFGETVMASEEVMRCYGITFAAVCIATPYIRNILVPQGRSKSVLIATLVGVFCGIVLLIVLPRQIGFLGVAAALAVSDVVTMTLLIYMGFKTNRAFHSGFRPDDEFESNET